MATGQLRDYVLSIEPGSEVPVQMNGDYFRVLDADGATVRAITDAGDSLSMREGEGARIRAFTVIRFRNESEIPRRVVVIVGLGEFESARLTGAVSPVPAATLRAVGDMAGGDTIPDNPARRQLVMRASADNGESLAIAGLPLAPGDTFELDITGAIDITGDSGDVLHVAEVI